MISPSSQNETIDGISSVAMHPTSSQDSTYSIPPNFHRHLPQTSNASNNSLLNDTDLMEPPLPKVLPESGSSKPWFRYLWCVPGTKTYLFLNNGRLEPPPNTYRDVRGALASAILQAQNDLSQHGDGPLTSPYNGYMTPDFSWSLTAPATNMPVFVQPSKGILTRAVLVSALTGLEQYASNGYDFGSMPMVFQINYGPQGEVGIGYMGFIDPDDPEKRCIVQDIQGDITSCDDVKALKVIT